MNLLGWLRRPRAESGSTSSASAPVSGGEEPRGSVDLSRFASADRVEIRTNLAVRLGVVTDPAAVSDLAARAVELSSEGWGVPLKGVPVATLRFEFYRGDDILGSLGVGNTFLAAHAGGSFCSRDSTSEIRAELLALAGMEDPDRRG